MLEKFNVFSKAVDSVGSAVDKIFTSDEERGQIDIEKSKVKLELVKIQTKLLQTAMLSDIEVSKVENEKRQLDLEKGGRFGKIMTYFNDIFRFLIQLSCFVLVFLYITDSVSNMNETKEYIILGAFIVACMKTFPSISNKILELFKDRKK